MLLLCFYYATFIFVGCVIKLGNSGCVSTSNINVRDEERKREKWREWGKRREWKRQKVAENEKHGDMNIANIKQVFERII